MEVRELTDAAAPEVPAPVQSRRDRLVPVLGWLSTAVTLAAVAASAALDLATPASAREAVDSGTGWEIGLSGLLLAVPGALLLSRAPRNAVSWVVAGSALFWALDGLASSWLTYAVQSDPPLPGASLAFWFVQRFGAWLLFGLPLLLLLYPDGRLPTTGRWRTVSWVAIGSTALLPVLVVTTPADVLDRRADQQLPEAFEGLVLDPTSLPLPEAVALPLLHVAFPLVALGVLLPLAVVVHRLRAASGEDRRRMRWLLWAGVVDALVMLGALLFPSSRISLDLALAIGLTGLAVTVGILRPRAIDIDRLLGGTLVYGGLAAGVVVLDLLVLGAAGVLLDGRFDERNALLVTLLVVAVGYVPLRAALWRFVRRWALGEREDPYRVVSGLAERLERTDDADQQLMAVASAVAEAFRSPYVGVEVTSSGGGRLLAEHGARPTAVQSLPIAYRGEPIGRLLLPRRGVRAQLLSRDERLLADVVRQAAGAARAGSLAAQLQASREQLVAAREEERRRLRRDLHDGLGPSLGAVVLRIDTARNLAADRPEEADLLLRRARDEVAAALADVRRLVHDLRPPALDDLGLVGAVRQQAERVLPPHVDLALTGDAGAELPAAVEVAAYRIASEALANVARHARASRVEVALGRDDGALVVTVTDDGCGIAPEAPAGVGLVSLRERAAELGGSCTVECPPDGGTVVRAVLPARGRSEDG
ncbi:Histidine kinase-, DNA gyrase B-, and HSP90-like ATPase [Blastococcus aurantiacus]|uniref:Histidine kinase-, DNA gyrase B-, and HSP90-like ATPase n=1 Tax=Blastococcus aurantiacus TaxID=1550231 RepID=A0A1G7HS68_9ACTN|nr:sensor histidine kinase [Blastococcus aurantiacus]SDF03193.1 Histidine kinase-, DNA gyrase B-, and HSP90-like ATPase [Blastococcus aurantiacus]